MKYGAGRKTDVGWARHRRKVLGLRSLKQRLTYANTVATLALFVALGGSSYAAVLLTGKNIKNETITSADVKNRSLLGKDFKPGQLPQGRQGSQGAQGGLGPQGPQGLQGNTGPPGPSTGPAGGDLQGSYPNPTLRDGSVTAAELGAVPAARIQREGAAQSVASQTGTSFTAVTFEAAVYDTDSMFNPSSPAGLTVNTPGIYSITGAVRWDGAVSEAGRRAIGIVKTASGIPFLAADTRNATSTSESGDPTRQNVSTVTRLAAGEFLQQGATEFRRYDRDRRRRFSSGPPVGHVARPVARARRSPLVESSRARSGAQAGADDHGSHRGRRSGTPSVAGGG